MTWDTGPFGWGTSAPAPNEDEDPRSRAYTSLPHHACTDGLKGGQPARPGCALTVRNTTKTPMNTGFLPCPFGRWDEADRGVSCVKLCALDAESHREAGAYDLGSLRGFCLQRCWFLGGCAVYHES